MDDTNSTDSGARWSAPPTIKARTAVQRSVDRLLDILAPERAAGRIDRTPTAVDRHRTPRGCILQAPAGAVTVSWFADAANDAALGELQIMAWRGLISRPGSVDRNEGASVVRELVLLPIDRSTDEWVWRAADGTVYDTESLAAFCTALLDEQLAS